MERGSRERGEPPASREGEAGGSRRDQAEAAPQMVSTMSRVTV